MDRIINIFRFDENAPLIFTQANFWIFFILIYFIYALVFNRKQLRIVFLLAVSLFFYYKTSGLFVGILLFSTLNDFFIGKWVYKVKEVKWKAKLLLTLSIITNLGVLFYFKYAYFFTDAYNALTQSDHEVFNYLAHWGNSFFDYPYFKVDQILLPVGISFYTFQTISYSVDIYRDEIKPLKSILDFGFFVSFFPQLVAGPIVRAASFVPQIELQPYISKNDFGRATLLIMRGLIKKMIFADLIAQLLLDKVFDAPEMFTGFANVCALIGYSLQIYGDFAGYTDIAIGLALLLGYYLPNNFDYPYKATSTANFWKRWHISLSTWLKDYLYIPLGGNRKASIATYIIFFSFFAITIYALDDMRLQGIIVGVFIVIVLLAVWFKGFRKQVFTNINIFLTMLIGGLWHGASWKFVIWGGLNGLGILWFKIWSKYSPYEGKKNVFVYVWKVLTTFLFITFTRIYFRGNSMEHISRQYYQITHQFGWDSAFAFIAAYKWAFILMGIGYFIHWTPYSWKARVEQVYIDSPIYLKAIAGVIVGIICYQAYSSDFVPFIYFAF